jgi:hypothetical protein
MKRILLFLLIIGFVFSYWGSRLETVEVNVVDSKGRPVEGASVVFSCMKCTSMTCNNQQRESIAMNPTNSSGISSDDIYCYEESHGTNVEIDYQGILVKESSTWKPSLNSFSMIVPNIYDLKVKVSDQNFNPIGGVKVRGVPSKKSDIHTISGTTGKNGEVLFKHIPSSTEFLLRFENGNEEKTYTYFLGKKDSDFSVLMTTYSLSLNVVDDLNESVSGVEVNVSKDSDYVAKLTDGSGIAKFDGLAPTTYHVQVYYKNKSYASDILMDEDINKSIMFDLNPPQIDNIYTQAGSSTEPIYVLADVTDSGSGLAEVKMYYSLDGTNYKDMKISLTADGKYRGMIFPQAKNTYLSYKIVAKDNEGNSNEEIGSYVVQDSICPIGAILLILPLLAFYFARGERS